MMSLKILGFSLLLIGLTDALFEGCDRTYNLNADSTAFLLSPYYPNKYPPGTSCRYKMIAPIDYEILAECTVNIDKGPSSCSTEYFYISRDGDSSLSGAEQLCGIGTVSRTTLFRTLVIAYSSGAPSGSNVGGAFNCTLTTRPQACDCGWTQNTRIVGGENAAMGEFPAMTALYNVPSASAFCGASIISHRAVLTAAHCIQAYPNVNDMRLLIGDYDLSSSTESPYAATYGVSTYYIHPGYNASNNANDIALVIASTNIEWSRGVGPICIPFGQTTNTFDYTAVNLVGWGTTSFAGPRSDILQKANVNVLPNSVCSTVYPSLLASQICTYFEGRDACQFDSGGPVVYKGSVREFLLGVISSGYACGSSPGVNTRLTSYINWIIQYPVGNLCSKPFN